MLYLNGLYKLFVLSTVLLATFSIGSIFTSELSLFAGIYIFLTAVLGRIVLLYILDNYYVVVGFLGVGITYFYFLLFLLISK